MIRLVRWMAVPAIGWAGAALWAYGVAVLQPLCEPGSPYWDGAENNTYWARDVRWAAILAVVAALLVAAGGEMRRSVAVAAGAAAWIAADVVLDRLDPGRAALLPATVAAGLLVTAAAVALARRPSSSPSSSPATAAHRSPRRRVVVAAVIACLVTAGAVAGIESPSDTEPELVPSGLAAAVLLVAAALAGVLTTLPAGTGRVRGLLAAALAGGWVLLRAVDDGAAAFLPLVLVGVAALAGRPWPGRRRAAVLILGYGVAVLGVAFVLVLTTLNAGRIFTALAGNEAINEADSDPVRALTAVLVAIVVEGGAALWAWLSRPEVASGRRQPVR